jgi:outer membrane lipoprotein SlyB
MNSTDKVKENTKKISNSTFSEEIKSKSNAYVNGAIAGGVVGILTAVIFKWKYIPCGVIGAIAGGYIGSKISESVNKDLGLKNLKRTKDDSGSTNTGSKSNLLKFELPDDI